MASNFKLIECKTIFRLCDMTLEEAEYYKIHLSSEGHDIDDYEEFF